MKKGKRSTRLMRNFLLSYLLILIIPLIFCVYAYWQAIQTIDKNAAAYHMSMLSQARDSLEMRIQEARLIAMQITDDAAVNSLLYAMERGDGSPFQIWECQRKLRQYAGSNQYISQAFLCVQKGRQVISTTYYHKELTQGKTLTVNGSGNAVLSPLFAYNPGRMVQIQLRDDKVDEERTLMYARTFPKGVVDSAYGNVCLIFDQDKLEGLLTFSNEWTGGYNAILDENNQLLVYSGGDPEEVQALWLSLDKSQDSYTIRQDGEEMSVTYLNSPETGWTYLSVYPKKQVLSETLYIRNLLLVYIALSVIVGLGASILLSRRNMRPVRQIIHTLSGAGELGGDGQENEYRMIQNALDALIARNHSLSEQTRDQRGIVHDALFRVLLNGRTPDPALLQGMAKEIGIQLEDGCFIGIRFDFEEGAENGLPALTERPLADYIRKILSIRFDREGRTYYLADAEMLALLYFSGGDRLGIYAEIQDIIREVESAVAVLAENGSEDCRLVIGISNAYASPGEVSRCAEEARFSAEYSKLFEFGRPVFYDMVSGNVNLCKFTINDHQYLLNVLKSGSVEEAQKAFNDLIERNIVQNRMNADMVEQLFYAIKGVLLEGGDFAGEESVKERISSVKLRENDFFSSFLGLEEIYISIAAGIGEKRSKKGNLLVGAICEYLEQEYPDSNITLTSTADRFGISDAYLSKLFREYANNSFAAYLEDLRIGKAKALLDEGRLKMVQIAEQTGYNSVESFRRAFKRITGVAPSEYKESARRDNR